MNTWYKRTLTCTRSRLYQFNFKFKKAPCQTGVFYNTSKDTWRYFIPETRLGVFLSRIKQASNELAFSFFVNSTSHNHSTTLTEAGNGVFHPTEHSYAKKKKSKILDLALFISDRQNYLAGMILSLTLYDMN